MRRLAMINNENIVVNISVCDTDYPTEIDGYSTRFINDDEFCDIGMLFTGTGYEVNDIDVGDEEQNITT
jgi:hypothetical protein